MPTLVCNASALVVATLYYYWRGYRQTHEQHEHALRQRLAYMLWVMANSVA
jgi:hypothetical protein